MKNVFLTEGGWEGKIARSHQDMRNDSAWIHLLDAVHMSILRYQEVKGFDNVFIMFPKGFLDLNMIGVRLTGKPNPYSELLSNNISATLKENNKKVYYIQEGPTYLFNDYEISDQFNFYNMLSGVDVILAHNEFDRSFYKGLFQNKQIATIPPVMIEDHLNSIKPNKEDKVIIGGNMARWYGGFQSYIVSDIFEVPKYIQDSHARREHEHLIPDLTHIPRANWLGWMRELSSFKYAVHLMPTPAAGTFNMNCAYFGIPCIGNKKVDTQNLCHPDLSIDVDDVESATQLATKLKEDKSFYEYCSNVAKENYRKYYSEEVWKEKIMEVLNAK